MLLDKQEPTFDELPEDAYAEDHNMYGGPGKVSEIKLWRHADEIVNSARTCQMLFKDDNA